MNKKQIAIILPVIFFCCVCRAESKQNGIDTAGLNESSVSWYEILDKNSIIKPEPNHGRYTQGQISEIADNIILYQKDNGGWPKNYDMRAILSKEQKNKLTKAKNILNTTFDNGATYSQIEYLAKAYEITKIKKYKDSCLRGIDFTLSAQYANGGWPQYFPLKENYSRCITFNDNAETGVMEMLKNITEGKSEYGFVDAGRRGKIKTAYQKGIDCILKTQIIDNGKLTGWCPQYDEVSLTPAGARAYELASICNEEGADVVLFLMSIKNPDEKIVKSIEAAVRWFEESKITGVRVEEVDLPDGKDRILVKDENAPPIWTRFYELGTHKPLFSDRRGKALYSFYHVSRERRIGYSWFNYEPQKALDEYPAWEIKTFTTEAQRK